VAVAVGEPRRAGAVAGARRAGDRRHVVRRAGRAAAAAVGGIGIEVDLAAVGLLVAIAVGESGIAGAGADAGRADDRRDVVRRAGDAAAAAVPGVGRQDG